MQMECAHCQELVSSRAIDEHENECLREREEMDTVRQPTTLPRIAIHEVNGVTIEQPNLQRIVSLEVNGVSILKLPHSGDEVPIGEKTPVKITENDGHSRRNSEHDDGLKIPF